MGIGGKSSGGGWGISPRAETLGEVSFSAIAGCGQFFPAWAGGVGFAKPMADRAHDAVAFDAATFAGGADDDFDYFAIGRG